MIRSSTIRLTSILLVIFSLGGCFFEREISAQFSSPKGFELSCVHIHPIMMKYIDKHITHSEPNSNLESRANQQFIKKLDSSKLYLHEGDIKEIDALLKGSFTALKKKDCKGIQKAYDLFTKRLDERVEFAKKTLSSKKFKFNPKAELVFDPDERKRAQNKKEADRFHENYIQYQVASYLAADEKLDEAKNNVIRGYERQQKRIKEMKESDLWAMYLDSIAHGLDPHSSYLSRDQLEDFEIQMRLSLEGIGATLSSKDGFTVIEHLVPGGAASSSGQLKRKDKILAVAQGTDGDYENVIEMDLRDVVRKIRGPKGSMVRLRVLRKKGSETNRFEVALKRDKIALEDEAAAIHYLDREINGKKKKVGVINLPSFYADNRKDGPSATKDVKKLLLEAQKENVDAIVLDLSTNGGGSLRDAVDIVGLFISKGNVVKQSQRGAKGKIEYDVLKDLDREVYYNGPLVINISRVSASASEIVSGALQDYKRALVVGGDHTFGKGSVQSVDYMPPGLGAIKTTVGMFFIPGGASTQHKGVSSDIEFPSLFSATDDDVGEKTLDYSLPPKTIAAFLSPEAQGEGDQYWKPVEKQLIDKLKVSSAARVIASEKFKEVKEKIKKAKDRGKTIIVGELIEDKLKEKEKKKNEKKGDLAQKDKAKKVDDDDDEEEDDSYLSKEERVKKYLERADILEAADIATELALEMKSGEIKLGKKED